MSNPQNCRLVVRPISTVPRRGYENHQTWAAVGLLVGVLFYGLVLQSSGSREAKAQAAGERAKEARRRVRAGLVALYDFQEDLGPIVKDRLGVNPPRDLRIQDLKTVRRSPGKLKVHGKTLIRSDEAATKISEAMRRSGEFTLEAWITPAKTDLKGPTRIVSLSKNPVERNFTLGQEGEFH